MGRSGALTRRVELWRKETTKGEYGEIEEVWEKINDLRSYTIRRSGRQTNVNDEEFNSINIRIQIRNQYDIREQDRVKYYGNMYDVTFLQPMDMYERWLMIHCSRVNE